MKKIIDKLIDECVVGVDTYSHNGSTWLIFTESKQWVIELTESKTLWYNYNFFKNIFNYTSMDVVENQHYITKWVEDNVINKNQVNLTKNKMSDFVSDSLIENGVKENSLTYVGKQIGCEDALENGVRHTEKSLQIDGSCVIEDTVQNGVKETNSTLRRTLLGVDDIIQNGIKSVIPNRRSVESLVDDTIENGVKEIHWVDYSNLRSVEDTIQNGIKETRLEMNITEGEVDDIIQDGVKLTQFNDNENKSWIEGVIQNGVKETELHKGIRPSAVEDTINNGVRHTLNTEYMPKTMVEDIIENGVKETKTPGKDGDIMSTIEWMEENKTNSVPKMIDDVIENGVKEIKTPNKDGDIKSTLEWMYKNNYQDDYNGSKMINNVIENGVKKTILRQHITDGNVETIIETGIKEVQPLPDQSGELIGYGNYYHGKEDRTKAFIDYLEETIKFGVKET
jgi:hypothetical protein